MKKLKDIQVATVFILILILFLIIACKLNYIDKFNPLSAYSLGFLTGLFSILFYIVLKKMFPDLQVFSNEIKNENIKLEIEFIKNKNGWWWRIVATDKTNSKVKSRYYQEIKDTEYKWEYTDFVSTIEHAKKSLLKELNEGDILK